MPSANSYFSPLKKIVRTEDFGRRIGLLRRGCTNRPFYLIGVIERKQGVFHDPIEQLGNYDPLPNQFNEKLVSIDFERLEYWIKKGVYLTPPVAKLLGLCGYFPLHPDLFKEAWINRFKIKTRLDSLRKEVENLKAKESDSPPSDISGGPPSDIAGGPPPDIAGGPPPDIAEASSQENVDSKT